MVYGTPTKKSGYGGGLGSMAKKIASDRQAQEAAQGPPQSTYKPIGLKSLSEELTAAKEASRGGPAAAARPTATSSNNAHSQIIYPKKKEDPSAKPIEPAKPRDLAAEKANTIIIYPKKKEQPVAQAQPVHTEEGKDEGGVEGEGQGAQSPQN